MTVATGFDVDYYLDQVGADYYLTAAGEPPGIWAGQGAAALGLRGQVGGDKASAKAMRALFHYGIGPDGVPLASRQRAPKYPPRVVYAQVEEAIARRVAALAGSPCRRSGGRSACRSGRGCGPARPITT